MSDSLLTIERPLSGLALDNSKTTLNLYNAKNKKVDSVSYKSDIAENQSYQKLESKWLITSKPTKGLANTDSPVNSAPVAIANCPAEIKINESFSCDASDSYDKNNDQLNFLWQLVPGKKSFPIIKSYGQTSDFIVSDKTYSKLLLTVSDQTTSSVKKITLHYPLIESEEKDTATLTAATVKDTAAKNQTKDTEPLSIELDEAKTLESGTLIKTKGAVSVTPGIFSKNTIFLSGSGLEVVLENGSWPEMELGNIVELTGKVSQSYGQKRVRVENPNDLSIIDSENEPMALSLEISDVGEDYESYLVKITGTISELSSSSMIVADEENNQAEVYIKRGPKISLKDYEVGQKVSISGVIIQNKDKYQILPRFTEDILIIKAPPAVSTSAGSEGSVTASVLPNISNKASRANNQLIALIALLLVALGIALRIKTLAKGQARVDRVKTRQGFYPRDKSLINSYGTDKI
jgi:hypothetical protein